MHILDTRTVKREAEALASGRWNWIVGSENKFVEYPKIEKVVNGKVVGTLYLSVLCGDRAEGEW